MKRRFLSVLLCLLAICCVFTACNNGGDDVTTVPETTPEVTTTSGRVTNPIIIQTTTPEPKPEDMPNDAKLLIKGVNVTSYVIVYGDTPLNEKAGSLTGKTIGEDIGQFMQGENVAMDYDYQCAVRLQTLIKEYYGYDIPIKKDSETKDASRYEILIGYTDRLGSIRNKMALKNYVDAYNLGPNTFKAGLDTQYVICGGSYGATWHAIDDIEEYFEANKTKANLDLSSLVVEKAWCELKTVACLGDSITRGSQGLPDGDYATSASLTKQFGSSATAIYLEQYLSYPATLQRELWKDYVVFNYGQGWATMRDYSPGQKDEGPYFYRDTTKFANCLEQSNNADFAFDVVLLMLGTNDASSMKTNWTEETLQDFRDQAKFIVDEILKGSPDAKFVMMNVPHRCDGHDESEGDTMMRDIQKQLATDLKLDGYNIYHYDMEAFNIENMGTGCGSTKNDELKAHEDYYNILTDTGSPDTTHPNYRGYGKIAEGMIDLLAYLLKGAEAPKYMINIG